MTDCAADSPSLQKLPRHEETFAISAARLHPDWHQGNLYIKTKNVISGWGLRADWDNDPPLQATEKQEAGIETVKHSSWNLITPRAWVMNGARTTRQSDCRVRKKEARKKTWQSTGRPNPEGPITEIRFPQERCCTPERLTERRKWNNHIPNRRFKKKMRKTMLSGRLIPPFSPCILIFGCAGYFPFFHVR